MRVLYIPDNESSQEPEQEQENDSKHEKNLDKEKKWGF